MLVTGGDSGNAYKDYASISHPGRNCGYGIYSSPHFEIPLRGGYSVPANGSNYHLILQCRAKPDKICIP